MMEQIYDAAPSRSVVVPAVQRPHLRCSRLRDMRAVRELRSLAYDLNGVRLTENAYGKFYRLRKVGIDVVIKRGRNGLRRNEGEKRLGNRQTAKTLKGCRRRRMVQHSNKKTFNYRPA